MCLVRSWRRRGRWWWWFCRTSASTGSSAGVLARTSCCRLCSRSRWSAGHTLFCAAILRSRLRRAQSRARARTCFRGRIPQRRRIRPCLRGLQRLPAFLQPSNHVLAIAHRLEAVPLDCLLELFIRPLGVVGHCRRFGLCDGNFNSLCRLRYLPLPLCRPKCRTMLSATYWRQRRSWRHGSIRSLLHKGSR